jgi:hypothetical protein
MVSSIARDTAETSSKPIVARTEANPANSGLTLAIIAGLVLSVLVNLILIAVLAGQAG